ncbi:MAG: dioxygenase extradiol [Candidatus Binatota bacterium]|jgi:4,5-DOPA dioxygenase extradiol|nr:dioxygenase extradiol [Candidatus Binatota bacterium]
MQENARGRRIPALFVGHGNPMNAIEDNEVSRSWRRLGETLPRPRAILSVSAHWYVPGCRVTVDERPRTLHDFGGFPRRLHEVEYPAPGSPEVARRVRELLAPRPVELDDRWGLDHGTWSVLVHLFPGADVPVVQLGIDETLPPAEHWEVARRLRPLREEGVLVLGSGNVVHNLHAYAWGHRSAEPFDWAARFERRIRESMIARDPHAVVGYEALGRDAALAAPTPEHFLPLVYVLAQSDAGEPVSFPVEGFDGGSISMLAVLFG